MFGGCVAYYLSLPQLSAEDEAAISQACTGATVPGAGAYADGAKGGLVTFTQDELGEEYKQNIFNPPTAGDQPEELAKVTAVLCLDAPTSALVGVCEVTSAGFASKDYDMIHKQRVGRVVDPSTGEVVAETSVTGFPDDDCTGISRGSASKGDFIGDDPDHTDYNTWVVSVLGE